MINIKFLRNAHRGQLIILYRVWPIFVYWN